MRVFLVSEEWELAEFGRQGLQEEGYAVHVLFYGSARWKAAEGTAFDIVVLDVMFQPLDVGAGEVPSSYSVGVRPSRTGNSLC